MTSAKEARIKGRIAGLAKRMGARPRPVPQNDRWFALDPDRHVEANVDDMRITLRSGDNMPGEVILSHEQVRNLCYEIGRYHREPWRALIHEGLSRGDR